MAIDPNNLSATATLTFNDDFNSFSYWNGSSGTWGTAYPWDPAHGGTNVPNNEEQWYINANYAPTQGLGTYKASNGVLAITAQPASAQTQQHTEGYEYTSGMITTYPTFSQTYGYFEMRAQLPAGQGLWPAFWLLPTDMSWPPEIDIMEVIGSQPDMLNTTVHYGNEQHKGIEIKTPGMTTGMHTYGVNWQADYITWYFDSKEVYKVATPADMHKPMYMLANLAVGGDWPGSPDGSTAFPAKMQIDYIRAYSDNPNATPVIPEPPTGTTPPTPPTTTPPTTTEPPTTTTPPTTSTPGTDQQLFDLTQSANATKTIAGTRKWDSLNGTSGHDRLDGKAGADSMKGGRGDDTYVVENYSDKVIEKAGQGIDTVRTDLDKFVLPANVENLIMTGWGDQHGIGNALNNRMQSNGLGDNILDGGAGNDQLIAGKYADTLIGGAGSDIFVFNSVPKVAGHVADFTPGVDMLDLRGLFTGYKGNNPVADGRLVFSADGAGNTLVKFDADGSAGPAKAQLVTTLDHVLPSQLQAGADFHFV